MLRLPPVRETARTVSSRSSLFFADWTRMLRTQLKSFFSVLTLLTNFDGRGASVVPILHCSEITQDRYRLSGVGVIELLI